VNQFIRLTVRTIPWFAAIFVLLFAVGYLQGDLKLSSIYLPGLIAGLVLTIVAVSAVGAAQALLRERRRSARIQSRTFTPGLEIYGEQATKSSLHKTWEGRSRAATGSEDSLLDISATVAKLLIGRKLSGVQRHENSWVFEFEDSIGLSAECPWRIVIPTIAFTDSDHGQQFGLPEPLDGVQEATRLLHGRSVSRTALRGGTGDLSIQFSDGTTLELLNLSGGYEAWQLSGDHVSVVAQGGGTVVAHPPKA
jgi:hypothetical protein